MEMNIPLVACLDSVNPDESHYRRCVVQTDKGERRLDIPTYAVASGAKSLRVDLLDLGMSGYIVEVGTIRGRWVMCVPFDALYRGRGWVVEGRRIQTHVLYGPTGENVDVYVDEGPEGIRYSDRGNTAIAAVGTGLSLDEVIARFPAAAREAGMEQDALRLTRPCPGAWSPGVDDFARACALTLRLLLGPT